MKNRRDGAKNRVVITGIGVLSPIGIGKDGYWDALASGLSGIKPVTLFDVTAFNVKVAGEITDFNPKEILGRIGLVDLDRSATLLLAAAQFALEDGQLKINEKNTYSTGISAGATFGSLSSILDFDRDSIVDGPKFVNPSRFPNTVINSPASRVAIRFGIKGLNSTVSTGMCSALDAIDYALHMMRVGRADRVLAASVEELCLQSFLGFYRLGYLSGARGNTEPLSCPFDARRKGIVLAEGAVVLILERLNSALKRRAKIYGEVAATSTNFDPYRLHKYNPAGTGMADVMGSALQKAGLAPEDIDCIFANANSTKDADYIETRAIKKTFGSCARKIPITAVKSMTGETYSVSGGLAAAAALWSIQKGVIPPCINFEQKDDQCDLNYIFNKPAKRDINHVMVNTFSVNGANTVLILKKFKGKPSA